MLINGDRRFKFFVKRIKWCELLMQMDKAWISADPFPVYWGYSEETALVEDFSFSLSERDAQ